MPMAGEPTPTAPPAPVVPAESTPSIPTTPTDWRSGLTGEFAGLAQEKSLDVFKGNSWNEVGPALTKAFIETKKLVGVKPNGLLDPGEKATPEEKATYQAELRKRFGVPDKPTDYKIRRPEVAQDGDWDAAAETTFLGLMHQHGAPPAVVQAALDYYDAWERNKIDRAMAEAKAVEAKLRSEYGPNYDARLGRANRAITEFGGRD